MCLRNIVCRMDGIIVDYAVTVLVNGEGVSSEQLNYLTLQSNQVESSYRKTKELSTAVYSQNKNDQQSGKTDGSLESAIRLPCR